MKRILDACKGKKIITMLPNGFPVVITKNALKKNLEKMQEQSEPFDGVLVKDYPGYVQIIFN